MLEMSFREKELACLRQFESFHSLYHVCSSENFDVMFTGRDDFIACMGIFAVCSKLCPVRIYTFQLMNNHFHLIAGGLESDIEAFVKLFKSRLGKYFETVGRVVPLGILKFKTIPLESLEHLRAAVAYVNRNGFIPRSDCSPYTYPWGANSAFFNQYLRHYYDKCSKEMTVSEIRGLLHSKTADRVKGLRMLDGCVSPLSFCYVDDMEKIYRDEKHYFYFISRNVEASAAIAKEIGEMMSYTDEDIYQIASKRANEICGVRNPSLMDNDSKLNLARHLHYDFNASNKQIQRILKIDLSVLNSMF